MLYHAIVPLRCDFSWVCVCVVYICALKWVLLEKFAVVLHGQCYSFFGAIEMTKSVHNYYMCLLSFSCIALDLWQLVPRWCSRSLYAEVWILISNEEGKLLCTLCPYNRIWIKLWKLSGCLVWFSMCIYANCGSSVVWVVWYNGDGDHVCVEWGSHCWVEYFVHFQ